MPPVLSCFLAFLLSRLLAFLPILHPYLSSAICSTEPCFHIILPFSHLTPTFIPSFLPRSLSCALALSRFHVLTLLHSCIHPARAPPSTSCTISPRHTTPRIKKFTELSSTLSLYFHLFSHLYTFSHRKYKAFPPLWHISCILAFLYSACNPRPHTSHLLPTLQVPCPNSFLAFSRCSLVLSARSVRSVSRHGNIPPW